VVTGYGCCGCCDGLLCVGRIHGHGSPCPDFRCEDPSERDRRAVAEALRLLFSVTVEADEAVAGA